MTDYKLLLLGIGVVIAFYIIVYYLEYKKYQRNSNNSTQTSKNTQVEHDWKRKNETLIDEMWSRSINRPGQVFTQVTCNVCNGYNSRTCECVKKRYMAKLCYEDLLKYQEDKEGKWKVKYATQIEDMWLLKIKSWKDLDLDVISCEECGHRDNLLCECRKKEFMNDLQLVEVEKFMRRGK